MSHPNDSAGEASLPVLYLCYEPSSAAFAGKLAHYPRSNAGEDYDSRSTCCPGSPEAEPIMRRLRREIDQAHVMVCVIDQATFADEWVNWEIAQALTPECNKPLVGVMLREHNRRPAPMHNCGAIFVPFKADAIRRAIEWALSKEPSNEDYTLLDD